MAGAGAAWFDFDGVFRNSTVWLNGKMLGNHSSGYTSFRYGNVLPLLKTSPSSVNVLVVRADATHMEGWFYEGGGIYRDVWLTVTAAVHVKPWGVQVISHVDEAAMDTAKGTAPVSVNVLTSVVNDGDTASVVRVVGEVFDVATNKSLGKSTSDPVTLPPAPTRSSSSSFVSSSSSSSVSSAPSVTVNASVDIGTVELWSLEHPHMYRVDTTVVDANDANDSNDANGVAAEMGGVGNAVEMGGVGNAVDGVSHRFAPRVFKYDATEGLFLNGVHVKVKGMANHMDFAGVGQAVPDRVQRFKIAQMKAMGANAWRCAHNPPNPAFLDAADDMGLLVRGGEGGVYT